MFFFFLLGKRVYIYNLTESEYILAKTTRTGREDRVKPITATEKCLRDQNVFTEILG